MLLLKEPISRKKEKKGTKNVNIFTLFYMGSAAAASASRKRKDGENMFLGTASARCVLDGKASR